MAWDNHRAAKQYLMGLSFDTLSGVWRIAMSAKGSASTQDKSVVAQIFAILFGGTNIE